MSSECVEVIHGHEEPQQTYVFPGSSLPVDTSNMLLHSFMCRHHLTQRAKIDLLQLLQMHLPENNQVPPPLYKFEKKYLENFPDCSPEVTEHYYCSACNASLSGPGGSGCSQEYCPSHNEVKNAPYFITVSIADQLKLLLKRKFLSCILPKNKPTTAVFVWTLCPKISYTDIVIVHVYLFLLHQHWQNKNLNILAG